MLGFIARCDNTGLGMESLDFVRQMSPDKLLVALRAPYQAYPERFAACRDVVFLDRLPTAAEAERFLTGLDTLFCLETPYDWSLFDRARARGVRTVLRINYEYLEDPMRGTPDTLVAPIDWYQPDGTAILPFPVDRARFAFRTRTRADTFVHVAGWQGEHGRNGTQALLEAIPLMRSDARVIIHSQRPLPAIDDPRLDCRIGDVPDNAALYAEGDVLVLPRRYGGQSLPMNEALSVGMPVLMIDMRPQNGILPPAMLIPHAGLETVRLDRIVEAALLDPAAIASTIDAWAGRDISAFSEWADAYADTLSWDALRPRYERLCRGARLPRSEPPAAGGHS